MATPYKYYVINQTDLENGALDTRYYTRNQVTTLLNGYVGKITGKSLVSDSEITKLAGIEAGAEVNNLSDAQVLDLTDGNETTLHKHNATNTPFTPTGNLSSTNVQNALAELDTEKASKLFATNLVTNGDFSNGITGWIQSESRNLRVVNNQLLFDGSPSSTNIVSARASVMEFNYIAGNKYYFSLDHSYSGTPIPTKFRIRLAFGTATYVGGSDQEFQSSKSKIIEVINGGTAQAYPAYVFATSQDNSQFVVGIKNVIIINLTTLFGAGKEPTKEQVDWLLAQKYTNSWFDGTKELCSITDLLTLVNTKANIAQEAWITPTFLNGWSEVSGYPVRYRKNSLGRVVTKGRMQGGTIGTTAFQYAGGYRPIEDVQRLCANGNSASLTRANVGAFNGSLSTAGSYTTYIDLSSLEFETT